MMCYAVCFQCVDDAHLKALIKQEGNDHECSICGQHRNSAFTVDDIADLIAGKIRQIFSLSQSDRGYYSSDESANALFQGDYDLSDLTEVVVGQRFSFHEQLVNAILSADHPNIKDGDDPFFDRSFQYEEAETTYSRFDQYWESALKELKYTQRFFSQSAKKLFTELFAGIESPSVDFLGGYEDRSIVITLPIHTELFRARMYDSKTMWRQIIAKSILNVGPPPTTRAGRMNVDGRVVFYGALDPETCIAELRPAIGNDVATIAVRTTKSLRVLDFKKIDQVFEPDKLSYFQPDYAYQVERGNFLRRFHNLIAQPVIPGKESDYLITQAMAEYLSHVYVEPLDGILFASAQNPDGVNIVLFPNSDVLPEAPYKAFPIKYKRKSVRTYSIKSIKYESHQTQLIRARFVYPNDFVGVGDA